MNTHRVMRQSYSSIPVVRVVALGLMLGAGIASFPGATQSADIPGYEPPAPTPEPEPVPEPTPEPPQACAKPSPNQIEIDRSLVVHDQATLGNGFVFSKTVGAILTSANLPADQAAKEAFVQTLFVAVKRYLVQKP